MRRGRLEGWSPNLEPSDFSARELALDRCFLPVRCYFCCVLCFEQGPRGLCFPLAEMAPVICGTLFAIHSRHRSGIGGDHARMAGGPIVPLEGWWWWPWWYPEGWRWLWEGVEIWRELGFFDLKVSDFALGRPTRTRCCFLLLCSLLMHRG